MRDGREAGTKKHLVIFAIGNDFNDVVDYINESKEEEDINIGKKGYDREVVEIPECRGIVWGVVGNPGYLAMQNYLNGIEWEKIEEVILVGSSCGVYNAKRGDVCIVEKVVDYDFGTIHIEGRKGTGMCNFPWFKNRGTPNASEKKKFLEYTCKNYIDLEVCEELKVKKEVKLSICISGNKQVRDKEGALPNLLWEPIRNKCSGKNPEKFKKFKGSCILDCESFIYAFSMGAVSNKKVYIIKWVSDMGEGKANSNMSEKEKREMAENVVGSLNILLENDR